MRYLRLRFAFLSPENVSALAVVAGSSRVLFHGHTNQIINGDLTKIKSQTPFEANTILSQLATPQEENWKLIFSKRKFLVTELKN